MVRTKKAARRHQNNKVKSPQHIPSPNAGLENEAVPTQPDLKRQKTDVEDSGDDFIQLDAIREDFIAEDTVTSLEIESPAEAPSTFETLPNFDMPESIEGLPQMKEEGDVKKAYQVTELGQYIMVLLGGAQVKYIYLKART